MHHPSNVKIVMKAHHHDLANQVNRRGKNRDGQRPYSLVQKVAMGLAAFKAW